MEKIIDVRFEDGSLLEEAQKLNYVRYLNRNLAALRDRIITNKGFVKITSKKGSPSEMTFVSNDAELNKLVNVKLALANAIN